MMSADHETTDNPVASSSFKSTVTVGLCDLQNWHLYSCMMDMCISTLIFMLTLGQCLACVRFVYVITQYGSTVYIGIAMVYPH